MANAPLRPEMAKNGVATAITYAAIFGPHEGRRSLDLEPDHGLLRRHSWLIGSNGG